MTLAFFHHTSAAEQMAMQMIAWDSLWQKLKPDASVLTGIVVEGTGSFTWFIGTQKSF